MAGRYDPFINLGAEISKAGGNVAELYKDYVNQSYRVNEMPFQIENALLERAINAQKAAKEGLYRERPDLLKKAGGSMVRNPFYKPSEQDIKDELEKQYPSPSVPSREPSSALSEARDSYLKASTAINNRIAEQVSGAGEDSNVGIFDKAQQQGLINTRDKMIHPYDYQQMMDLLQLQSNERLAGAKLGSPVGGSQLFPDDKGNNNEMLKMTMQHLNQRVDDAVNNEKLRSQELDTELKRLENEKQSLMNAGVAPDQEAIKRFDNEISLKQQEKDDLKEITRRMQAERDAFASRALNIPKQQSQQSQSKQTKQSSSKNNGDVTMLKLNEWNSALEKMRKKGYSTQDAIKYLNENKVYGPN